jgi:hypothetical protein
MRLTQIPHDRQARPRPARLRLSRKASDTGDTFPGILKIASAGSTGTDRGRTPRSRDHKDHRDPREFGDPREFWGYLFLPPDHPAGLWCWPYRPRFSCRDDLTASRWPDQGRTSGCGRHLATAKCKPHAPVARLLRSTGCVKHGFAQLKGP